MSQNDYADTVMNDSATSCSDSVSVLEQEFHNAPNLLLTYSYVPKTKRD